MNRIFLLFVACCAVITGRGQTSSKVDEIIKSFRNPHGRVLICAHRGDWRNFPENSLESIESAITTGVDIVEVDVQQTKDGEFVLMHDSTLDRTTTGKGLVREKTLKQIQDLYLKDGLSNPTEYRVPTLRQALAAAEGRALLYLDKTLHKMPEILGLLKQTGMVRNVVFMHPITALEAKAIFGELLSAVNFVARIESSVKDPDLFFQQYLTEGIRPLGFQLRFQGENSNQIPLISRIKSAKFRVGISTLWPNVCAGHNDDKAILNPDQHWGWHIDHGISFFNTDRPGEFLQYLNKRKEN